MTNKWPTGKVRYKPFVLKGGVWRPTLQWIANIKYQFLESLQAQRLRPKREALVLDAYAGKLGRKHLKCFSDSDLNLLFVMAKKQTICRDEYLQIMQTLPLKMIDKDKFPINYRDIEFML